MELQGRLTTIQRAGLGLAAISYDPVPVLADFARRRSITFPLLSDAGSATIKRYGLLNTTVDPTNALFGYPFPGTFIVDHNGVVTSRFFEDAYEERDTVLSMLVRLGHRVDVPATKVSGAHLSLVTYATDQVAAQGTHFSVVVDVTPAKGTHVYAPGAASYLPVALKVQPQAGVIVRSATFPRAEDYFFKPLNEHVPVYQHPFRIVQDLMLDPSRGGTAALKDLTTIAIAGNFEYQACDDKVCFAPQSLPLTWRVSVRPLDRERAKPR